MYYKWTQRLGSSPKWVKRPDHSDRTLRRPGLAELPHPAPDSGVLVIKLPPSRWQDAICIHPCRFFSNLAWYNQLTCEYDEASVKHFLQSWSVGLEEFEEYKQWRDTWQPSQITAQNKFGQQISLLTTALNQPAYHGTPMKNLTLLRYKWGLLF